MKSDAFAAHTMPHAIFRVDVLQLLTIQNTASCFYCWHFGFVGYLQCIFVVNQRGSTTEPSVLASA